MQRTTTRIRWAAAAAAAGAAVVVSAALLSDRVPGILSRVRAGLARPWWFPWKFDDALLHFSAWFVITLLAVVAVRSMRGRIAVAAAVTAAGPVLEYLQLQWTATRAFEMSDVVANLRGAWLGLAAGLVIGGLLDRAGGRATRQPVSHRTS